MPAESSEKRSINRLKVRLNYDQGTLVPNGGVSKLIRILSRPAAQKKTLELANRSGFDPSKMADHLKQKTWKGKKLDDILGELH